MGSEFRGKKIGKKLGVVKIGEGARRANDVALQHVLSSLRMAAGAKVGCRQAPGAHGGREPANPSAQAVQLDPGTTREVAEFWL